MTERIEVREGREYRVTVLPEAKPPRSRAAKTRYHMGEVEKQGDVSHKDWPMNKRKRRGRRKK